MSTEVPVTGGTPVLGLGLVVHEVVSPITPEPQNPKTHL